jgi:hypothetical protein
MTSLWTDLLYLHGYLIRRDDLAWRHDTEPQQPASNATVKPSSTTQTATPAAERCGGNTAACA